MGERPHHPPVAQPHLAQIRPLGVMGQEQRVALGLERAGVVELVAPQHPVPGQPAQRRGPCTVGGNGIATDAQDLGIVILELLVLMAERGCLSRSTSCEVEYVEREHHVLLTLVAT